MAWVPIEEYRKPHNYMYDTTLVLISFFQYKIIIILLLYKHWYSPYIVIQKPYPKTARLFLYT